MWNRGCWDRDQAGAGRGWGWRWESDWGPMIFGINRGGRRHGRGGRMFEQGDLKFVILQLLEEKPRHGYEIIKELEERSGGRYSPSAGTVYPTLTLLEEMGYAAGTAEAGGKKVYAITDEGRRYLAENRTTVDDVLGRLGDLGDSIFGEAVRPAHEAMGAVGRAYWRAAVAKRSSPETIAKIAEILRRTAAELDGLDRVP